jgi:hypothetical protein
MDNKIVKENTEDKDSKTLELLKIRSNGAVLRDGLKLYLNNFRVIFKASWFSAILYAIVIGSVTTFTINVVTNLLRMVMVGELSATNNDLVLNIVCFAIGLLLVLCAETFLFSSVFSLLHKNSTTGIIPTPSHWYGSNDKRVFFRTAYAILIYIIYFIIYLAIVFIPTGSLSIIATAIIKFIVSVIFLIAFPLLAMRMLPYIININKSIFGFSIPVRYWGAILSVSIGVAIMVGIALLITTLPSSILLMANIQSLGGTIYGDPTGMPSYMIWMNIGVFTLAGFIQAYVHMAASFPFYYLYGSIEKQKE